MTGSIHHDYQCPGGSPGYHFKWQLKWKSMIFVLYEHCFINNSQRFKKKNIRPKQLQAPVLWPQEERLADYADGPVECWCSKILGCYQDSSCKKCNKQQLHVWMASQTVHSHDQLTWPQHRPISTNHLMTDMASALHQLLKLPSFCCPSQSDKRCVKLVTNTSQSVLVTGADMPLSLMPVSQDRFISWWWTSLWHNDLSWCFLLLEALHNTMPLIPSTALGTARLICISFRYQIIRVSHIAYRW